MAERIQVELVDDIDGSPAKDTVTFALDGVTYEIDLSEHRAQRLRSVFAQYIEHARRAERPTTRDAKQREREERQTRQANRQLTEQIRGAAQRSKERLKEKDAPDQKAAAVGQENEQLPSSTLSAPLQEEKPLPDDSPVPAVAHPQFSSAVD